MFLRRTIALGRAKRSAGWLVSIVSAVMIPLVMGVVVGESKVKLRFSLWINDPAFEAPLVENLIREYQKKNPNVEIELTHTPYGEYHNKVLIMEAGGIGPDIMMVDRMYLASFVQQGILMPLDSHLKSDKHFDLKRDAIVGLIGSGMFKGRIYGFPVRGGPCVFSVNADMFEKYGVPSPLDYVKQKNWNWSTFIDAGRKLTKDLNGDGTLDQYGLFGAGSTWAPTWVPWVWQNGGEVFNEDGTKCLIDTPEAIGGLQFCLDLSLKYKIAPVGGSVPFEQGKAGLGLWWVSEAVRLAASVKDRFKADLAPMPAGKAGYAHVAGGCPVCVSKSTRHPEEAYEFAKWFALEYGRIPRGMPFSRELFETEYIKSLSGYFSEPHLVLNIAMAIGKAAPEPTVHPKGRELEAAWTPIFQEARLGKISAEVFAKRIREVTDAILAR